MRELKPVPLWTDTKRTSIQFFAQQENKMHAYCLECMIWHRLTVAGRESETYADALKQVNDIQRIWARGGWVLVRWINETGNECTDAAQEWIRGNDGAVYNIYREDENGEILFISAIYPQGVQCAKCGHSNNMLVEPWSDDECTIIIDGEPYEGKTVYKDEKGFYWYPDNDETIGRLEPDQENSDYFWA